MLGRGVAQDHQDGRWQDALDFIKPLTSSANLSMANLESPLTTSAVGLLQVTETPSKYNLCGPASAVQALSEAGFDLLTLANNHARDCSSEGLEETGSFLEKSGIIPVYPGYEPARLSVNGVRLAVFAFDDVTNALDLSAACQAISRIHDTGDIVVVSIHWGSEYQPTPNSRQQELARSLSNCGASLIWGHHPHVVQPIEWLENPRRSSNTLAAYSLGNAMFDQYGLPDVTRSALLMVTINDYGVQSVRAYPFEIEPWRGSLRPASQDSTSLIMDRLGINSRY